MRRRRAGDDDRRRTQVFTVRRAHGDGAPSLDDAGAAHGARLQPLERRRHAPAPVADIARARRAGRRTPPAAAARGLRRRARRSSTFPSPPAAGARPTSPAPSTPRAASCSSCASASRGSACAWSRSTCRPRASRRPPACIRARWRATIRTASRRSSAATAASAIDGDGARLRGLRADPARPRRPDLGRRLGRHLAGDAGHARAADRRAQGDGLDHGQRRHAALRRPERHLHDVFGHRRAGHQPHQRAGARQRRACAGRHDRAPARPSRRQRQAGARPDDVRRHHAVRAGGDASASATTTTASSSTPPASAASRWKSWPTRACSPA